MFFVPLRGQHGISMALVYEANMACLYRVAPMEVLFTCRTVEGF